jgi:ribonucleoside-triphosphate reductase (formate)
MQWVQFRSDDPQLEKYGSSGYPVRELETYKGHTIVGFPTAPTIATLDGIEDHLVMAGDASVEEQFAWLQLGEAFWLEGHDVQSYRAGMKTLPDYGNQISYTLKYKPQDTDFDSFMAALTTHMPSVRCVSVMPQEDNLSSAFEYLPFPERSFAAVTCDCYRSQTTILDRVDARRLCLPKSRLISRANVLEIGQ